MTTTMTNDAPRAPTKSEAAAADVAALFRARNPLLWIVTREEARVEGYLFEAAAAAGYVPRTWDVAQGVADAAGELQRQIANGESNDPAATLNEVRGRSQRDRAEERGVWIMRDLAPWLGGAAGALTLRSLRNLARSLPGTPRASAQAIVVITPSREVPPELAGHATVIDWPLPDRAEIAAILDAAVDALPEFEVGNDGRPDPARPFRALAAANGTRDAAIDAAVGLSGDEAAACYARSLVQTRRIEPAMVAREKRRVIARDGLLEWFDPLPGGLAAVGGLDALKAWLVSRSAAYTPAARAYGLPAPKGVLLVGMSGCGKSLTAKAAATAYGVPLIRLDTGALKSKFVGESESNLRKAFDVIAAIGRCVVWLDEIEKAMQGATSGSADGGVSADALGAILNWMQERSGEAFVVATANDVEALPPELLRKGRFDELFFVDLPTQTERVAILDAALRAHGRGTLELDVDRAMVATACEGFTGSEVAALVPEALFVAFSDEAREINTDDLLAAAASIVPLSTTAKDKVERLRKWGSERARSATRPDAPAAPTRSASPAAARSTSPDQSNFFPENQRRLP